MQFQFQNPWLLLLGLLIPVAVYFKGRSGSGPAKFSTLKTLKQLKRSKSIYASHSLTILRTLCLVCLVVAIARPQSGKKNSEAITEGVDIMLAMDVSGSMKALDFTMDGKRINRLEVIKNVVGDFIKARENDRMGMVVFSQEAFTQCPLTLDHGVLLTFLERVKTEMAGDGTAIGAGIGLTAKRLKDLDAKSKVIILLTDGRNNAGRITPTVGAELAKEYKIKIYTVGTGTKGKAPFLVNTPTGPQYIYDEVDIDEDTMKEIAKITGGQYFRATDTESLKKIYAQIDKLEKNKIKVKEFMEFKEQFLWPLLGAVVCLFLEMLLANTRFRKIP